MSKNSHVQLRHLKKNTVALAKTGFLLLLVFYPAFGQSTFKVQQDRYPRVRQARENCEKSIDSLFHAHKLDYPPKEILITAYKKEQLLHLWARPDTVKEFSFLKEYAFTAFSGVLGPKRKQGDLQIPEGFYNINHFNPYSNFHLSMKVSYPNKSDSILGKKGNLGNEIRIHGSFVTIGCIPIGDEAIEELYIICVDARSNGQREIPVYIFPGKMDTQNWSVLKQTAGQDSTLLDFWNNLHRGYDLFSVTKKKLLFQINKDGKYIYEDNTIITNKYPWFEENSGQTNLQEAIEPPTGFIREYCSVNSFADWLRHIPLKPGKPKVYLYNGSEKPYQDGHYAVIDIDIGQEDLQQCADAIMRLYGEYLFSKNEFDRIAFDLTNGDEVGFRKWITGYRPTVSGNTVSWQRSADPDSSYDTFRAYLKFIFTYAGTYSLSQETQPLLSFHDMMIGDLFIEGGFPGHAVLVTDMAVNPRTGEKVFLLSQSYMPAQDMHILRNLNNTNIDPWYKAPFVDHLNTPEWTFKKEHLRRFNK